MKRIILGIRNTHTATKLFIIILVIFIGFSTFTALKLKPEIIPDEPEHFIISKIYATSWSIPTDSPLTYKYGYLGHKPFLFYWINGRALNILEFIFPLISDWRQILFLRLVNVLYSTISIIFCYLLSRELIKDKWWQLLGVFYLTNTLMFVFLSGGVSYDNLANLCCFASIYYFVRVLNKKAFLENSLLFLIFLFTGTIVKITTLPLSAILFAIWLIYVVINRKIIKFQHKLRWKHISLLVVLLGLLIINFSIFGKNLIVYKGILPACNLVLNEDQCNTNINIVQGQSLFLKEPVTINDIINGNYPDPIVWFLDFWVGWIVKMVFGIFGHWKYFPTVILSFYRIFLLFIAFMTIKYWKKPSFTTLSLIIIFIFYTVVLLKTNYESELISGFKHIAIQGRYIFPVIGIFYTLSAFYISTTKNVFIRRGFIFYSLVLFLWGGPLFVYIVPSRIILPTQTILSEVPVGEIMGATEISQEFISRCYGTVTKIDILYATYNRTNTNPVIFRLTDSTGKILSEQFTSASSLIDNSWFSYKIPSLGDSFGKTFRFSITSPKSIHGNAITVWGSLKDDFPDGTEIENGKSVNRDLVFRYSCNQPVLTDWFYR